MNIVILALTFPPQNLAGLEIAGQSIAKYLAINGHEVHVITSLVKGLPKISMEQGFHVHRVAMGKVRFVSTILFWLKTQLIIKRFNPQVIHVQSIGVGAAAFLAKKLLNKPYVIWAQGSDIYLLSSWIDKQISRVVLRNADAVIALTGDMRRNIKRICDRYVYVIPNGINLESFQTLSKRNRRSGLGIKQRELVIIFVGRLHPIKGVQYLIQAINIVKQKDTNIKLLLVGKGPDEKNLKRLVEQLDLGTFVIFTGQVPNEEVFQYMIASDIFVLPSLSEGFPLVSLEAMACGLPFVGTRVRGMTEIIKDGENGFLVKPENPDQLAEKILLLLENSALRYNISRNNRQNVKKYSWSNIVGRLEELYESIKN